MKKLLLLLSIIVAIPAFSQNSNGLLLGGGIGFESLSMNVNNSDYLKGKRFYSTYQYNLSLGYRFRIESFNCNKLFFDIDPLLRLQTLNNETFFPGSNTDYTTVTATAHDINFQLAVSPSANYKLFNGLYVGLGIEPTWNIITNGKHFDIPVFARIGYDINHKIEFAVTYRQGFMNTIDKNVFDKGRTSDLNISVFIPFHIK